MSGDNGTGNTTARIAVRVRPGASRTKVGGAYGTALVVAVGARAVDGKATEAALRAIADALGVRRRQVALVTGATSRDKVVEVTDAPADLDAVVARLRDGGDAANAANGGNGGNGGDATAAADPPITADSPDAGDAASGRKRGRGRSR